MSMEEPGDREAEKTKLLLVDDRPENLFALRTAMRSLDAEIHSAESGSEALEMMLSHRYAVVVLDVQMPGMDGFEMASLMRRNPETRDVPIIFVTAISKEEQYRLRGYEVGAVDYLLKPLDPVVLLSKVHVFLRIDKQKLEIGRAMRELRRLSHRNELILSCAEEGICGIGRDGRIVFANDAAEREVCGTGRGVLVGEPLQTLLAESGVARDLLEELAGNRAQRRGVESRFKRLDGSTFPVELSIGGVGDEDDPDSNVAGVLVFRDITERKNAEEKLLRLARYDTLTGLANRALFHDALGAAIGRARRSGAILGVMHVDLDDFKMINDEHGHDVGDAVLTAAGHALTEGVRCGDLVARLGGDEFAIILEDVGCADNARRVGEKVVSLLAGGFVLGSVNVSVGGSVGIAVYEGSSDSPESLLKMADTAMYVAKRDGRNKVAVFTPDMAAGARRRVQVVRELDVALANETLDVAYQPQFESGSRRVVGMEALARWNHPQLGFIPPDEFIPLAEQGSQIETLGDFMLRRTMAGFREWDETGVLDGETRLAVNISAAQLTQRGFPDRVAEMLRDHAFPPGRLELELTETAVMRDLDASLDCLQALHSLGVNLAVDDFGTGYASLSYLQRLPIDSLKIDRSFVAKIGDSRSDDTLVTAILGLARELGLRVIAEGVETELQAQFLESMKCDVLQGYLLARPQSPQHIERLLTGGEEMARNAAAG